MTEQIYATAVVDVRLEVHPEGSWGPSCTVEQIQKQAKEDAITTLSFALGHRVPPWQRALHLRRLRLGKGSVVRIVWSGDAPSEQGDEIEAPPIPMLLFCPRCGEQHVDRPEPEKGWTNPPHRSHQCHACSAVWRPADVATTGIATIETKGKTDTWAREEGVGTAHEDAQRLHDAAVRALGGGGLEPGETLADVVAQLVTEHQRLKVAMASAGNAMGVSLADVCSVDFLCHVPEEIRLARGAIERDRDANAAGMKRLEAERDAANAACERARADALAAAAGLGPLKGYTVLAPGWTPEVLRKVDGLFRLSVYPEHGVWSWVVLHDGEKVGEGTAPEMLAAVQAAETCVHDQREQETDKP